MSAYPPPYSNYDRKQQERALKQQAKLQRDLYRQQTRAGRRSSILGPLLVLAIGVVALLISLGKLPMYTFATWYAHWWPVVIVAAGILLAAEWGIDQQKSTPENPIRRSIGGGAVTLLIILIIFGFTSRTVHDNRDFLTNAFSINSNNIEEMFGDKYQREQQIDQAFAPGTSLSIDAPHGDIAINGTPSTDNQIHITIAKQINARSESDANAKASAFQPQLALTGTTLHLTLPSADSLTADLTISLPAATLTTINAQHGAIRIAGMAAPVNLTADRGDVDLSAIAGPVDAHLNSSHDSFSAHDITGDLSLHGRADDINITNVSGQVAIEGEYYGDTHFERLGGLSFQTSRTHFTLAKLPGEIDMSSDSEFSGSNMTGPTQLRTRSRNIAFQQIAGPVDISNTNGSVDLTPTAALGPLTVDNQNGEVTVTLPDSLSQHGGIQLDAQTRDGSIDNDLTLTHTTTATSNNLQGSIGDAATHISLKTTHADINIHHQPVPPAPPTPPAVPAPPTKPTKTSKLSTHPVSPTPAPPPPQTF